MALVIIADVGGATSNSYVTLAEAETYFESDYHSTAWDALTDDNKNQLLASATRRLEMEDYYGDREDTTTPQRLKFPRINLGDLDGIELDSIIPTMLKEAQYELSKYMISVDMSQSDISDAPIDEAKVGSIQVKYTEFNSTDKDILPPLVESLLSDLSKTVSSGGSVYVSR